MALPFDLREMVRSATQLRAEREEVVRIAVLVEVDAPDPLVDALRDRLRPRTAAARLQIEVVEPDSQLVIDPSVDVTIAVIGRAGSDIVRILGRLVRDGMHAVALVQHPRPEELAPLLGMARDNVVGDVDPLVAVDDRLARWIADRIPAKRLALANNFAFLRRHVAEQFVRATSWQNGVVGTVAIIPGADLPIMTANQVKMILQIAAAYGEDLGAERLKELVAVVGGGFTMRAVARQLLDFVPGFGWAIKGGIGYTGTIAMGRAAIAYFERGADLEQVGRQLRSSAERAAQSAAERARRLSPRKGGPTDGNAPGE